MRHQGWAVEGHPSAVTRQYAFGAGGHIREAWGHRHKVQGDAEWPVSCGTWMGCGRLLVWVSSTQNRHSRAQHQHPSTHHHTSWRAVGRGVSNRAGVWWHAQVQVVGEKASVGARVNESNQEKVTFDRHFIRA